jgi:AmmeMemoRadiSam system protein A
MLDNTDKTILLKLAREALQSHFSNEATPARRTTRPALLEQKGAFVSLHRGEELRGCIGQLSPDCALFEIVQHCALSAALEDTRFAAVMQKELKDLSIEISVLTPFHRIRSVEEIEVGRHGLYIVRGRFRGLLLPQVATQYNWDRTQFLEHTCNKSGLPASAWRDPHTIIHTFEAEVFSDSNISTSAQ